jgi:uncharacterized membrane protein/mono/diheme cytochrome c family protein
MLEAAGFAMFDLMDLGSPPFLTYIEITPGRFVGRLHPVVVHFPIALVMLAAAVELVRAVRRQRGLSAATPLLVNVAAASGVIAAITGWLIAANERGGDDSSELFGHRWLGTVASVLLVGLAWRVSVAAARRPDPATAGLGAVRFQTVALAGLVGFASHLGGEMVYGKGYLLEGLGRAVRPDPVEAVAAEAPAADTTVVAASLSANAATFRDTIEPIFAARCEECHGNSKRKGGLQLVPIAKAFPADGPDDREDWTIEPGDAAASLVVRRVELPRDDPDAMPPEGEPLTPEQISAIKAWIDGGAEYPKDETAPAVPVATSTDGTPARPAAPVDPKAIEAAIAAIAARGAIVQPLFAGSPLVEVNASLATPEWTDAELPLLDGLAGVLVNLNLARSGVTDAGVAALPPMPELVNLRLDSTAVGDAAVKAIAANPKLEAVNLVSTAVGDAGLAALAANRSVQRIYVWKSKVTASGRDTAERLRAFEVIGFEEPPPPKPEENPPETSPEPPAEAPKP